MGFIFNDRRQQKIIGYCLSDFVSKYDKSSFVVDIVIAYVTICITSWTLSNELK